MNLVILWMFTLALRSSISVMLPTHTDFQKVGEIIFNNEEYNVLRPTSHVIGDYFEDYMLRRENENFPTNRLFIDDSGFRHYWTGFEKTTDSLRKTALLSDAEHSTINADQAKNKTDRNSGSKNSLNGNSNETNKKESEKSNEPNDTVEKAGNDDETNSDGSNEKENENRSVNSKGESEESVSTSTQPTTTVKIRETPRRKKRVTSNLLNKLKGGETAVVPKALERSDHNIVKTTFFCPYFGVITMSAFVD